MPEQYFSIPLANHAGLTEVQAYLRSKLGDDVTYQDPAHFHITLVYVKDGDSLNDLEVPANLPIFGLAADSFEIFDTPDGYAVTLRVQKSPQLIYLQAAIFYAAQARGVLVSEHSYPGLYRPHITLAYVSKEPDLWSSPVPAYFEVSRFALSQGDYEEVASFPLVMQMPDGSPIREMAGFTDVPIVGEFKGSYPTIKPFPDVDIAALTQGDADPMFIVQPIAEEDAISQNNRHYGAEIVDEIEKQVRENRPMGEQGHPNPDEIGWKFNTPNVYWIGLARVGKVLYGKGYIPPGETREMVRRIKAVRGKLATSIFANAETVYDKQRGVWRVQQQGFLLQQIDLAPALRAGIPSLAVEPQITKEIHEMSDQTEEETMDRSEVIREMTAADAAILPDAVRQAVLEAAPEKRVISELAQIVPGEASNLVNAVKGIIGELDSLREKVITQEINAQVTEQIKLEAVRGIVAELVKARKPKDAEAVKGIVAELATSDTIKPLLESALQSAMGPTQERPGEPDEPETSSMMKPRPEAAK